MPEHPPDHEPYPTPEDEGIPDLQDGTPEAQWAGDPQEMPLPGDEPVAAEEYGVTAEEQLAGDSLDRRLGREEPEEDVDDLAARRPAGRLVEQDEGAHPDEEEDAVAEEAADDVAGLTSEERAIRIEPE